MRAYLDPAVTFEQARAANPTLAMDRARYSAKATRQTALDTVGFVETNVQRFCLFAFDMRWAYVTSLRPMWNEPRPQLLHILPDACGFLVIRPQRIADPEGFPAYWTACLAEDHVLHKDGFLVPVVENLSGAPRPNLSLAATAYLAELGIEPTPAVAATLLHHALATLYSPAYLAENDGGLRQGWPRVPLPNDADALQASAILGKQLAALLDPDAPAPGVTTGTLRPEIACIAIPSTKPGAERDWTLRNWGNRTDKGVTMPLRGRVEPRPYSPAETAAANQSSLDDGKDSCREFTQGLPRSGVRASAKLAARRARAQAAC